jgi:hypothetical protein
LGRHRRSRAWRRRPRTTPQPIMNPRSNAPRSPNTRVIFVSFRAGGRAAVTVRS